MAGIRAIFGLAPVIRGDVIVGPGQAVYYGTRNGDGTWPDGTWRVTMDSGATLKTELKVTGNWITKVENV